MLLTVKEAMEKGYLILDHSKGSPAQVGYDLSVKEIREVESPGAIWRDKTDAPILGPPIEPEEDFVSGKYIYVLDPGVYDVTFWEGCSLPNNVTAKVVHRSSVNRNGGIVESALFDPGFSTKNIGTMLYLTFPLTIEVNSRLGQIYFFSHNEVENPYNGQWQGDKWREQGNPLNN